VGGGGAQQLAGGSLNIAHSGYPDFARASLRGAPLKIIINDIIASPYAVFAKPQIKQIADLKGKMISIGGVTDVTLIYIKAFLASAGLKASDVDFVYAKAAGDRFSALVSGGVDATLLNPPTYFKAEALGYTNLGETAPHVKDIPFTVWAANSRLGRQEPGAADGLRAQLQARCRMALQSRQQAAGDRHPGQARQAGSQGFGVSL
jgi:ABC-type nitrate/sulfonate/bicarbonate transport system substrate-binding protein